MLRENHVHFEMAPTRVPTNGSDEKSAKLTPEQELLERKVLLDLQDPYLKANDARIGIAEPEDAGRSSSALLFKGAREVHAMLDVLRQFFLGSPLPSGFMPPANLPTLIAPVHFTYA